MIKVKPRLMRLRIAVAGIAFITAGLALSAGGNAYAQTTAGAPQITHPGAATPAFAILCNGDICLQTQDITTLYADVKTWPYTVSFKGHFELINGCGLGVNSKGGDIFRRAGKDGYTFRVDNWQQCGDSYKMVGWQYNGGHNYNKVGTIPFAF